MDNFLTTRQGYSALGNITGVRGYSVEWVKDDTFNLDKLSPPGFYIVRMTEDNEFVVDPYYTTFNEDLSGLQGYPVVFLKNKPININSEVILSEFGERLKRDVHYRIDYSNGEVTFLVNTDDFGKIVADYQTLGVTKGPYKIDRYEANNVAIPGVILAFGDRLQKGDEQVVILDKQMRDVAQCYAGRWQLAMDMYVVGQDADQQERITDFVISSLWAEWQDPLVNEGIEIESYALSGESEDLELEIPEEYSFTGGISLSLIVDWHAEQPIISEVRAVSTVFGLDSLKDKMSDLNQVRYEESYDSRMNGSGHQLGLQPSGVVLLQPSPYEVKTRVY